MRTRGHGMPADRPGRRTDCARDAGTVARRALGLLFVLAALAGCRDTQDLEVAYGQRRGTSAGSVNGTSVLAGMFDEAGFQVSSASHLAASLHRCDVIVWAPDDFRPPAAEAREFFEVWFASQERKTLVFIGRDYDAAPFYWEAVSASAPVAARVELMRRRARATAEHDTRRLDMPAEETIEWFTARRDHPRRKATRLDGPWSAGIDAAQSDIHTQGLLQIPTDAELSTLWSESEPSAYRRPDFEPLLSTGPTTLVSRVTKPAWGNGQLIVVTNGSFLLNLPLVNHEHRKLAGHLIQACQPGSRVAFLESGSAGPLMLDWTSVPKSAQTTREQVLLLVHWCVLGLAYCFCVFPIFGRPKTLPDTAPSEFVQHVDALGELLKRTRDEQYARRHIEHYYAITRRDPNVLQGDAAQTSALRGRSDLAKEPAPQPDGPA